MIEGVSETTENKVEKQNVGFLGMLLGAVGDSLLGNLLAGKEVIRAGEETIKANLEFQHLILWLILKYKGVNEMFENLMVFIQKTACLKLRMRHM